MKNNLELREFMESRTIPEPNSGCLIWLGAMNPTGYGMARNRFAHRVAYELATGVQLDNPKLVVRHICDVRCCVNPNHLLLGTAQDNTNDMIKRGRKRYSYPWW